MKNPFLLRVIPSDAAFCDRDAELADLERYAQNHTNVVLYSPRRATAKHPAPAGIVLLRGQQPPHSA